MGVNKKIKKNKEKNNQCVMHKIKIINEKNKKNKKNNIDTMLCRRKIMYF